MMQWIKPGTKFDFVGQRHNFYLVSLFLIVGSLMAVALRGLNYGIDFKGGYEIQLKFKKEIQPDAISAALKSAHIEGITVRSLGDKSGLEYLLLFEEKQGIDANVVKTVGEQLKTKHGLKTFLFNKENAERIQLSFEQDPGLENIKKAFSDHGLRIQNIDPNTKDNKFEYQVRLFSIADQIEDALKAGLNLNDQNEKITSRIEYVGPQVGEQLRNQGILAVLYSLVFMLIYIAFRFDFYFGPGAIVCLFHDTIVTIGAFALTGKEFNLQTIAALLTIVGYSMNDTIVVFDRIRENNIKLKGKKLEEIINLSLNETLSRTILTTFVTMLVVIAMTFLGGGVLADFGFALMVGFVIGTYSSVAVASPIYIYLRNKFDTQDTVKTITEKNATVQIPTQQSKAASKAK